MKETYQELFCGWKKHSTLSFILKLFHKKCIDGWSNKSFTELLGTLKETLLEGDKLSKSSYYEVKNIILELGLGYEKIHVCPNSYMLFWKEHEHDDICTVCGASRWEENEISYSVRPSMSLKKKHKKAKKIMRWFPIKPRLLRLFVF